MAFLRVLVLIWADLLASYVMFIMQKYLTDVWKLGFVKAAGIMNIATGLPKVLPLILYCFVDAGLGNKWMLFLSSISFATGLGFLSMSTPPVLHKATRTCKNYDEECIGPTQKALFYTALALIAVGMSGHIVSLVALFDNQFEKKPEEKTPLENEDNGLGLPSKPERNRMLMEAVRQKNGVNARLPENSFPSVPPPRASLTDNQSKNNLEDGNEVDLLGLQFQPVEALLALVNREKKKMFRSCMLVLIPVIAVIALPYIKPWDLRFGIPAIITFLATVFFLFGFRECKEEKSEESAMSNIFKVILAATLKMFKRLPSSSDELYEDNSKTGQKLPHTNYLRCLDKAAIEEGPANRKWIRCTVTEVEQTKIIIHMFPIWITLILCGVVTSVGSTYFVEQAKNMNYKVGKLRLPDSLLLILYASAKSVLKKGIYSTGINNCYGERYAPRIGIAFATISATLCCIVAAAVETKRHEVIINRGLVNKPGDKIPMTVFWILPQYLLLACLDSFYENSVTQFLSDQSPPLMKKYLVFLNPGLSGLGFFGSVLSVFVVGRISKRHGKPNWFQNDLNASRLDRYYWTLAGLSAVNFMCFLVCAMFYPYRDIGGSNGDEERGDEGDTGVGCIERINQCIGDTIKAN